MAKKVVLVTGASRGIGKAIAVKFAKKGYNVIINCAHREQELMQKRNRKLSGNLCRISGRHGRHGCL